MQIASGAEPEHRESLAVESHPPAKVYGAKVEGTGSVGSAVGLGFSDVLSHPLMAVSNQAFCLIDPTMAIRYVSDNWADRLHFRVPEGAGFSDLVAASQRDVLASRMWQSPMLSEPGVDPREVRVQMGADEQQQKWYALKIFSVGDLQDTRGYLIGIRDVEEEVRRESELHKAQIKAEMALKSRSEFLGNMSHELRTPLNAILGFAEMMERGVLGAIHNKVYQDYIKNIRESGHDLLDKINDLIAISSLETGGVIAEEKIFYSSELISYVMELHAHRAFSKDVQIEVDDTAGNIGLLGDRVLLAKALANIVHNAVVHSKAGSAVHIHAHRQPKGEFALVVSDQGQGIEQDRLSELRRMLRNDEGLHMGNPEGRQIGLGLAVAKEYVTMHDGSIIIDSTKNEGTIVKIVLPAERVAASTVHLTALDKPGKKVLAG